MTTELRELPYLQETPFTADHCLKCNICTQACPVVSVTDLFPGPKTVGPQAQRFRDPDLPSPDRSVEYCSGCGICTLVCPHGVRVMEINAQAKAKLAEARGFSLRDWILGHNAWWGVLGTLFAPLLNRLFRFKPFRWLVEKTLGISARAAFPTWAGYTFRSWWRKRERRRVVPADNSRPVVVYYHGCSTNSYEPHIGKLAVQILEHNGFRVIVPPQACCGLPLQSNGMFAEARRFARKNVHALADYARRGIPIVGTASSCIMALKSDYEHVLGMHDADTKALASGVYDFCEFLWHLHQQGKLKTDFRPVSAFPLEVRALIGDSIVPYHAPCQLKAHGIGRPALDLLDLIPELRAIEMDAECCGIAGTYGYKAEKRQIAEDVGAPLFRRIRESGARLAICDTETCRWHIAQMSGARVVHPIELLAYAYGIAPEQPAII
ncbi:MAG: anaerobic glycerol-3-phosphate dehydrogenase subunit C [Chloroflexi bacterium]|nr:anaerobic glycerol-3-phosphate dehydrogenase subunit C [Chloroflexota bacterium]